MEIILKGGPFDGHKGSAGETTAAFTISTVAEDSPETLKRYYYHGSRENEAGRRVFVYSHMVAAYHDPNWRRATHAQG